jgi:hypothetical protein
VVQFRELSERTFGVQGEDVFKVIEDRWRAHAEEVLRVGSEPRKR